MLLITVTDRIAMSDRSQKPIERRIPIEEFIEEIKAKLEQ